MKYLTLKEDKTKAVQGRKNKKGGKKGDMEEVQHIRDVYCRRPEMFHIVQQFIGTEFRALGLWFREHKPGHSTDVCSYDVYLTIQCIQMSKM